MNQLNFDSIMIPFCFKKNYNSKFSFFNKKSNQIEMLLTSNVDLFFAIGISNEDDNDDVDGVVDSVDDSSFSLIIISLFVLKFWLFSSTTFDSSLVEQFVDFKLGNFLQIKESKMNKIKLNQIITRSGLTQTQQHNVNNIEQKNAKSHKWNEWKNESMCLPWYEEIWFEFRFRFFFLEDLIYYCLIDIN